MAIDAAFGPLRYSEVWYAFAVRAGLVFGLAVVGLQAGYATAAGPRHPALAAGSITLAGAPHPRPLPGGAGGLGGVTVSWHRAPLPTGEGPGVGSTEPGEELPAALAAELLPWRGRLLALMADEQPWLEPELTLPGLAQRLGTNASVLSKVINQGCGQNFNDFVNTYRVQEAQRKLADARYAHYSLVGVALASGFNSKSTFNRVFKKLTGQAPGEATRPKS